MWVEFELSPTIIVISRALVGVETATLGQTILVMITITIAMHTTMIVCVIHRMILVITEIAT